MGENPCLAKKARKPLVITYSLINRHQLNLERSPMNIINVEKPPEGILTILTPKRNYTGEKCNECKECGRVFGYPSSLRICV